MVLLATRFLALAGLVGVLASVAAAGFAPYPLGGGAAAWLWVLGAVVPAYVLGAVALALRPDHLTARWMATVGSSIAIATAVSRAVPLAVPADAVRWLVVTDTLQVAAMLATVAAVASLLVAFPDARYRHRYQRRLVGLIWAPVLAAVALWPLALPSAFVGSVVLPEARVANPLHVPALAPLGEVLLDALRWRAGLWLAGAAALLIRYRRGSPDVRAQFLWPLMGAVLFAIFLGVFGFLRSLGLLPAAPQGLPQFSGWVPGLVLLMGSMLGALLHHRLIEVDLWLRRSLLYGGASAAIALAYLGLAGLLGLAAGQRASLGVGVLATLGAVIAFEPVRRRIEAWSRRVVHGNRVAGEELLRRVGGVLEDSRDTRRLGETLGRTIVEGIDLEWVRIVLSFDEGGPSVPVAATGIGAEDRVTPDLVVPLTHAGTQVGFMECGPKRRGVLSGAEEELLATVGRQAALAVRNAGLTTELERRLAELHRQADELAASRSRIVQAQMGERRRIERDLHDGVQQDIVAAIARIRLARNQVERDPEQAAGTLAELQDHTKRMLGSLRELSRGIHPLVLTHRGLVEALHAQVARMPIGVQLDVAPEVRRARYAEETEAAAYFVVTEGLTNVIKHAGADTATVTISSADGQLHVAVADEGRGCVPGTAGGSGLVGLRDRVESVGGTLSLRSQPGRGAVLTAALPATPRVPSHA